MKMKVVSKNNANCVYVSFSVVFVLFLNSVSLVGKALTGGKYEFLASLSLFRFDENWIELLMRVDGNR